MEIKLKNAALVDTFNLLQEMQLKGKASRARTKLNKLINDAINSLGESEIELIRQYGKLDENGEPKKLDNGNYQLNPDTLTEFNIEHTTLLNEDAEISGATYGSHLQDCIDFLNSYDGELSGKQADAYDALLDALENKGE